MEVSTRTSEGFPFDCIVCGKQMVVSACAPLGDTVCPHCGALVYSHLKQHSIVSDDEKMLADLGVLIETDDYGEVISAQLNGPRYSDSTIEMLASLKDIPRITLNNTAVTREGIERLRQLLPETSIEGIS